MRFASKVIHLISALKRRFERSFLALVASSILPLIAIFALLISILYFQLQARLWQKELLSRGQLLSSSLADRISADMWLEDRDEIARRLETYLDEDYVDYVAAYGETGTLLAYRGIEGVRLPMDTALVDALAKVKATTIDKETSVRKHGYTEFYSSVLHVVAVREGNANIAGVGTPLPGESAQRFQNILTGYVRVGISHEFVSDKQRNTLIVSASIMFFLLIVGIGFTVLAAALVTRRIRRVTRIAHELRLGNYNLEIIVSRNDEIGELAKTLDLLKEEIKQREQQLREWGDHLQEMVEERTSDFRKSEERYRDVVENSIDMIHSLDAEGRWLSSNRSEQEFLGWNLDQLLTMRYLDIVAPEDKELFRQGLELKIQRGMVVNLEVRVRTRVGAEKVVSIHANAIFDQDHRFIATRSFVRDVTDRKAFEVQLLQQKAALEQSIKDLDEFTYVVSHDLKTPLRGFDAYSKFLLDEYGSRLDDQGRSYLESLRRNSIRMKDLLDDLLTIARLSRQHQEFREVDLGALIRQASEMIKSASPNKAARISIPEQLPVIVCEPKSLQQVFTHLFANAVKFNDNLEPVIEVLFQDRGDRLQFGVRDNGIGIDARYFDKIFQIFQRLHTDDAYEGTGAGLAICKRIVEIYGGKIWVESALGQGSTFYFVLPRGNQGLSIKQLGS